MREERSTPKRDQRRRREKPQIKEMRPCRGCERGRQKSHANGSGDQCQYQGKPQFPEHGPTVLPYLKRTRTEGHSQAGIQAQPQDSLNRGTQ
jgi:hypothetical protein